LPTSKSIGLVSTSFGEYKLRCFLKSLLKERSSAVTSKGKI
jgi:hypothetical protein